MSDYKEIEKMRMESRIEGLISLADKGDSTAINRVIEPIGNDDATTKAFIELLNLARVDEVESPASDKYSPKVAHIRNACRVAAFKKLTEAADRYYAGLLESI